MKRDWRPMVESTQAISWTKAGFDHGMQLDARQLIRSIFGKVTERIEQADGVKFVLDVWTEDQAGVKLTDGDAAVDVRTVV